MIVHGRTWLPILRCISSTKRKKSLRYLKLHLRKKQKIEIYTFEENLKKASGRMYILRVCEYYGFTKKFELRIQSLIISLFNFGVELWGGASCTKCITQIDKFVNRAYTP